MKGPRAKIEVSWDLDALPGWNDTPSDVMALIEKEVLQRISHYDPEIKVIENGLRERCGGTE